MTTRRKRLESGPRAPGAPRLRRTGPRERARGRRRACGRTAGAASAPAPGGSATRPAFQSNTLDGRRGPQATRAPRRAPGRARSRCGRPASPSRSSRRGRAWRRPTRCRNTRRGRPRPAPGEGSSVDRAFETLDGLQEPSGGPSVPVVPALEVSLVGTRSRAAPPMRTRIAGPVESIVRNVPATACAMSSWRAKTSVWRLSNGSDHSWPSACDVDELRDDADATVSAPNAAFEHGVDTELRADLAHVRSLVLEVEDRRARDDAEPRDLGEGADQLLGQAVGQDLRLQLAVDVGEGQDCDRPHGGRPATDGWQEVRPTGPPAVQLGAEGVDGAERRAYDGGPAGVRTAPTAGRSGRRRRGGARSPSTTRAAVGVRVRDRRTAGTGAAARPLVHGNRL